MRKIATILMFTLVFFASNSCSKKDDEEIVDCFAQQIYMKVHNATDATNPKLMNYSATYSGDGTLTGVKWNFGDGTTGTGTEVTHTYSAAGTYDASAEITVKKGGSACTSTIKRPVTIN
ncbi:PKD domain-containing protein [Flavobacterium branchiicola]|uniref:PKD domain-containing protein n=1 Tax=Flavobacterium branchiicola TaxID=1114875 RepID=A0ABV9PHY9_9FLAO|nr:PKD domain-containing protein [Flavobacterium branchiicola]MBS7256213.1 PKD domain-containing protein [Flavobacterium branchiicola]